MEPKPKPYWNSYVAGVGLGLVLLAAFVVAGRGLGASGALTRFTVYGVDKIEMSLRGGTAHAENTLAKTNPYMSKYAGKAKDPLDSFLVYMFLGIILGGFASAYSGNRLKVEIVKGPHSTDTRRLLLAFGGGLLSAIGARLARGCTSGQALTGGATLAVGSWLFILATFAGGFALAYFLRREWL